MKDITLLVLVLVWTTGSFSHAFVSIRTNGAAAGRIQQQQQQQQQLTAVPFLQASKNFYNDFEGYNEEASPSDESDDDDDDDEDILLATKDMDWRTFRRNLAAAADAVSAEVGSKASPQTKTTSSTSSSSRKPTISEENQDLLKGQNKQLYKEFSQGVWAHVTATPEVGGLVLRLPLEIELQRNTKHSVTGARLRQKYQHDHAADASDLELWYKRAQNFVDSDLTWLSEVAVNGQIDASTLDDNMAEMLQLYLDQQETWQEVCLVLEQHQQDSTAASTTLVLNRPMAMKLTENLGQLVLLGAFSSSSKRNNDPKQPDLNRFMRAFSSECAVYIGGPDDQDLPATLIHGIADLPGATEIAPGTGIYRGGLKAAVDGVLSGKYKPLEFRFFVGRHVYDESSLDLTILLGKYQPIACARSLALKQCISLPKPLWHEVMELCGGDMHQISQLELEKRNDVQIQIVDDDEDDEDYDEDDDEEDEITDELEELSRFDDDDDEEDDEDEDYYYRR